MTAVEKVLNPLRVRNPLKTPKKTFAEVFLVDIQVGKEVNRGSGLGDNAGRRGTYGIQKSLL